MKRLQLGRKKSETSVNSLIASKRGKKGRYGRETGTKRRDPSQNGPAEEGRDTQIQRQRHLLEGISVSRVDSLREKITHKIKENLQKPKCAERKRPRTRSAREGVSVESVTVIKASEGIALR